ncbi:hypothetical protein GCM10025868_19310 [Angustibacter aerolatus]|uniref:PPM-type phosphatase domain-containing protein n=1 Tax=Angustibacter aerolatus TaxID=1162965 RepID=A0ABQ6JEP8_9ACTN|nr:SpoIIE family protein phosphatase [Angustibacter aerolatus]GMA86681.1 hypothetical protein GCM10025868_19310 [Angustibacter aerolatus]
MRVHTQRADPPRAARVWLPLLNGSERLGVLEVEVHALEDVERDDSLLVTRLRRLASLTAEPGDGKDPVRRHHRPPATPATHGPRGRDPVGPAAPLTFVDGNVAIAGVLEPAYEVAGDTFDYSVDPGRVHVALFDAMGHGLASARLVSLAVASYRNGRRAGRTMTDIARATDAVLTQTLGEVGFATALLMEPGHADRPGSSGSTRATPSRCCCAAGSRSRHCTRASPRRSGSAGPRTSRSSPSAPRPSSQATGSCSTPTVPSKPGPRRVGSSASTTSLTSCSVTSRTACRPPRPCDGSSTPCSSTTTTRLSDDATLLLLEWRTGNEDAVRS